MMYLLIGLITLVPLLGSFSTPIVYLLTKNRKAVFAYDIAISAFTFIITLAITYDVYVNDSVIMYRAGGWPPPVGIVYILDKFTALLALTTSLVALLIAIYSVDYITDERYAWYMSLLLGNFAGILGVVVTGDLFNLFVMLEVTAVSSYALVMYYRRRPISILSGLKYAFVGALGTVLFLFSLCIIYGIYGTFNIVDIFARVHGLPASSYSFPLSGQAALYIGIFLVLSYWTFSIKSGVAPNHFWLPDAHPAAPSPVSALLSGLVVNTGAIGMYKVLYLVFSGNMAPSLVLIRDTLSLIILITGGASALLGALLMMIQTDVKRLIAYSTVMNTGFMFMALGTISRAGLVALLFHMITHSIAKSTLFLSAGVLIKAGKSRRLESLAGLGKLNPVAGIALSISILTLSGVPPLPGFLAKLLLYTALFEANIAFAILFVIATAIALISYMRLFYTVMLEPYAKPERANMRIAGAVLAASSLLLIALGITTLFYEPAFNNVILSAVDALLPIEKYFAELASNLI